MNMKIEYFLSGIVSKLVSFSIDIGILKTENKSQSKITLTYWNAKIDCVEQKSLLHENKILLFHHW